MTTGFLAAILAQSICSFKEILTRHGPNVTVLVDADFMGGIDCDFHPHSLAGATFPCKETLFLLEHAKDEIARQYEEGNGVVSQRSHQFRKLRRRLTTKLPVLRRK